MSISNAYCKKHDEIEPENNNVVWTCPKCSRENMKKYKGLIDSLTKKGDKDE